MQQVEECDVLVIGSGIAGLTYSIMVAGHFKNRKILVLTKADAGESNTKYAQGGVAAVWNQTEDSFEKHIQDTLRAGDGLCNKEVVEMVVRSGPALLQQLIDWGARFDTELSGVLNLGLEGGHSANRILHHKDMTGFEIERLLLERIRSMDNIELRINTFVYDLIKSADGSIAGAVVQGKQDSMQFISAPMVLLASGGAGQVYRYTTNPYIATGDGVAMAYRIGAEMHNMEFIQFHPTALYQPLKDSMFLISEAVRGAGAYLLNEKQERFMFQYDDRGELASRDIVSRAIYSEIQKSSLPHVYLDCRHINREEFSAHFPNIMNACRDEGILVEKDLIPVVPVMHYLCGGINTDLAGQTNVKGLFACGECACTGLHGANRLASNSLLEALVYARNCYEATAKRFAAVEKVEPAAHSIPMALHGNESNITEEVNDLRLQIRQLMSEHAAIVRTDAGLKEAHTKLSAIHSKLSGFKQSYGNSVLLAETENMATVALLIVEGSVQQKYNAGAYFNTDRKRQPV
jgi:L-aspartate oxidase